MTAYDSVLVALTIWREARGESQPARNGVFHVILNRAVQSPKYGWPSSAHGVCVQPYQFSCYDLGNSQSILWPLEKNAADWRAWEEIQQMIDSPLLADPTQGAQFYHDQSVSPPFRAWLGANATLEQLMAKHTVDISTLSFYAL